MEENKPLEKAVIEVFNELLDKQQYKTAIEIMRAYKTMKYNTKPLQEQYNQKVNHVY